MYIFFEQKLSLHHQCLKHINHIFHCCTYKLHEIPGSHLDSVVLKVAQVTDNVTHVVLLHRRLNYDFVEREVFLCFIDNISVVLFRITQVDLQSVHSGGVVW